MAAFSESLKLTRAPRDLRLTANRRGEILARLITGAVLSAGVVNVRTAPALVPSALEATTR